MQPKDVPEYIDIMEEIKRRTDVVWSLLGKRTHVVYYATQVESMTLQIRMITELIGLASLVSNKDIFEENRKKFNELWHPKKIFASIRKLNSNFYPIPIEEQPPKDTRVKSELVDMKTGFMKQEELIEVHGRCGNILHAINPFSKRIDYDSYEKQIASWINKIMMLLNCHMIRLFNEDGFYLVHMNEDRDNKVHMYTFLPAVASTLSESLRQEEFT